MKRIDLRIVHTEETIHPVHDFEARHEDFHGSALVEWNPGRGDVATFVLRVAGDPDVYREVLEEREATRSFTVAPVEEGLFSCLLTERPPERDRTYLNAFGVEGVVVRLPVRYNPDRSVDLTFLGAGPAIEDALAAVPDAVSTEVRAVTEYDGRVGEPAEGLTERQREAVEAALAVGYYDSPRGGTVGEVATRLDVATSTAAEHLRKAERRTMRKAIDVPWRPIDE